MKLLPKLDKETTFLDKDKTKLFMLRKKLRFFNPIILFVACLSLIFITFVIYNLRLGDEVEPNYSEFINEKLWEAEEEALLRAKEKLIEELTNPEYYLKQIQNLTKCLNKANEFRRVIRGNFWVLENYIKPTKPLPHCYETITYTTHGDLTFLDNLIPLVRRWMAPISMALYCPGTDYRDTLESVIYLRNCMNDSSLIRDFVTFHFYFDRIHTPEEIHYDLDLIEQNFRCIVEAPFQYMKSKDLYKAKHNLSYYINVGRNVARETALTHFIFASDVELYPNPGVVENFLRMYARLNHEPRREVFVFPIFEVQENVTVPNTKTELQNLLKQKQAITFHEKICKNCHLVPRYKEWFAAEETDQLDIFTTSKRTGSFRYWEPIYIATNHEPLYEESLHWEGKSDKMTQGYILCVLGYDFHVLNNAFLVHRPGIKTLKDSERPAYQKYNRYLIATQIKPQIIRLYGNSTSCFF